MLKRERQRTEEANQRTEEANQRTEKVWQERDARRKLYDARIQELINENRKEHQAMLYAIAELTAAIAELRQQNQRRSQS